MVEAEAEAGGRLGGPVSWLSHPLDESTPAYGGAAGLEVTPLTVIEDGDTANTLRICCPNHLGSHVDVPRHFFSGGPDLDAYGPEDWIFLRPVVVDVHVESGRLVRPGHVEGQIPKDCDLLLIRTGHEAQRGDDRYWSEGPGLAAELGWWLRTRHRTVRAVGVDLISVTSRLRRQEGREAHRAFLDPNAEGRPILLLEDMRLAGVTVDLLRVVVAPLRLAGADGAPVTVIGEHG